MPKNKKPARKTPPPPAPDRTDELTEDLAVLAQAAVHDAAQGEALDKMIRNALRRQQDEVLYGAIELARFHGADAYALLRDAIEEAAASIVLRAADRPAEEIDAFLVPLLIHSQGGLRPDAIFADADAFELLRASFQQAGLESADAGVVLISHLYDVDEIDRISYCELNTMLREVAASMHARKLTETPALTASIRASARTEAGAGNVTELRFLLGFVRRRADDPFYATTDAWFEQRMARYRQWTAAADALLRANIAPAGQDPGDVSLDFLVQDQFFAARRRAMSEGDLLTLMAHLTEQLQQQALLPAQAGAVVGPAAVHGDMADDIVLRVALYRNGDSAPLTSADLPFDLAGDLQEGVDELCEILHSMGIATLSTALRFGDDGYAIEVTPWQPA